MRHLLMLSKLARDYSIAVRFVAQVSKIDTRGFASVPGAATARSRGSVILKDSKLSTCNKHVLVPLTPVEYLIHEVGISKQVVDRCLTMYPSISYMEQIGMTVETISRAISRSPQMLGCKVEAFEKLVEWILAQGIPHSKIPFMLMVAGQNVAASMEHNLEPKRLFLLEKVGLSQEQLAIILCKLPQLLAHGLESMESKVNFLKSCYYSDKTILKMIQSCPEILASSLETLSAKVQVLGVIFGEDAAHITFSWYPRIIMHNSLELKRSYDYLINTVKMPRQMVRSAPSVVMRSVDRILQPRFEFLSSQSLSWVLVERRSWIRWSDSHLIGLFPEYKEFLKKRSAAKANALPSPSSQSSQTGGL